MTLQFNRDFGDFINATRDNRDKQQRDRHYIDGHQWTSAESKILKGRKQAPVVINRIKPKHEFMLGLELQSRTDPKAYPRTPQHEKTAEAITDALRFVADNTTFDQVANDVADNVWGEGYGGVIVEMDGDEIDVRPFSWDRFYFDPHSRRHDFKDASFLGITAWLYKDEAEAAGFPADKLESHISPSIDTTFDDRPLWIDKTNPKRPRVRINEHYYKKDGEWWVVFFTGDTVLIEPQPSPYLDYERDPEGKPGCPIEANSCFVDSDNNRYGNIRSLIHIQDEINHRRSKALHMLSNAIITRTKGAVDDGDRLLDQVASGRADIEVNPGPDITLDIDRNQELSTGQLAMLQEAKGEIDAVGVNSTLAGKDERSLSGRAILAKQQGGSVELGRLFDRHNEWKRRVYRQIWNRIKQFWTAEKWVRVTDDERNVRFVGLNVTGRTLLAQQLGVQPEGVEFALQQSGVSLLPGELERVAENDVAMIDVDIIVAESPDLVTIQQEQFEVLANLAQQFPQDVTFADLVELSNLRNKDQYLDRIKGEQEDAREALLAQQQQAQEVEVQSTQAETASKIAKARKDNADASQTELENAITQLQLGIQ